MTIIHIQSYSSPCVATLDKSVWSETKDAVRRLQDALSVSALLTNCNIATCWHVELCMLSLLHLSYNSHSSNRFSCSIKFFHLIIALGLALGESWPLLAVYKGLFPREGLLRHTYKNHLRREKGCKLMDQI